jgi:hypothetical protein
VLRPTWHLVARADLRWLLALTGPRVQRGLLHLGRYLEIDRALVDRSTDVFRRALAGGRCATRDELGASLGATGIDARGGRLGYLVLQAELEAVICSGPRRRGHHTYALVDDRVPPGGARGRDEALAELAQRYVVGHGPAQDVDLAWWAGLTLGDARRGLTIARPRLRPERVGERAFWVDAAAAPPARPDARDAANGTYVRLLPAYDELLVAFRDRSDALDGALPAPARAARVILSPVVIRDGLVVGTWRDARVAGGGRRVEVSAQVDLGRDERSALRRAIEAFRAFVDVPVATASDD